MSRAATWTDNAEMRRATRLERHRQARREQIIQAAVAVIGEHGPAALTGQIAERAGLARPHVYRHFASKADLNRAVGRYANRQLIAHIRPALAQTGTPVQLIAAPMRALMEWADANPNLYQFLVFHAPAEETDQRPGSAFVIELSRVAERYLRKFGADPAPAESVMVGVVGLINASVTWWLSHRRLSRDEMIERLTAQCWLILDQVLRNLGVELDPDQVIESVSGATS